MHAIYSFLLPESEFYNGILQIGDLDSNTYGTPGKVYWLPIDKNSRYWNFEVKETFLSKPNVNYMAFNASLTSIVINTGSEITYMPQSDFDLFINFLNEHNVHCQEPTDL